MLDRIRIQEIEKAIFRMRETREYGGRNICKNEPFLIIDDAKMSDFTVNKRSIQASGRSTEATTSTTRAVTFSLTNGKVMLDLFNAVFGNVKTSQSTTFTRTKTVQILDDDELLLPTKPVGEVILYITDDYGSLTKIAPSQYSVEENKVTFIKPISYLITYVYEEEIGTKLSSSIGQIGEDIIGTLEMQCVGLDIMTEEKIRFLIKFNKVSVTTRLTIDFNDSTGASSSVITVHGLPEELQNKVNKDLFTIEVLEDNLPERPFNPSM